MHEIVYRAHRDSFYCNLSEKYPSFKMFFWCDEVNEVLEIVVDDPEEYRSVLEEFRYYENEIMETSSDERRVHIIVKKCTCASDNSVLMHIGNLDMLHIFPSVVEDGYEFHRVIAFRHEKFAELTERLESNRYDINVMRMVPYKGILASSLSLAADTLISGLTEKQLDSLLIAHRHGYYQIPRKSDIQTITRREALARTTYQEHLRKAENKLMDALVPYLVLFKNTSTEQRGKQS